jgi:methylglyoxal synthase
MFSDEGTRTADVQAIEKSLVAIFTLDDYSLFITQNSSLAIKFKSYFIAIKARHDNQTHGLLFKDDKKYVALIAHNEMKSSLVEFCKINSDKIGKFPLIATGTTGSLLYKETGMVLSLKVASGPLGGDQAVGKMISTNNIKAVIFFRDPLSSHPHHADIEALGRLCDVYQIPFATNPSTANAVLEYINRHEDSNSYIKNRVLEKYNTGQSKVLSEKK